MDTFGELITAVQSDLSANATSSFYNLTAIKSAINRAKDKVGGVYRWPETDDALKTSTKSLQEYYDYPQNWRPYSVWKLVVDGVDFSDPLSFKSYLYEKENSMPSGFERMWANQWRRFFFYPIPTTDGNNNIEIHGQKALPVLVNDTDVTIWSYSMREVNNAIVLEAVAILKSKGDQENDSEFRSTEAKQIVLIAISTIKAELAKYEQSQPMFEVPDMFAQNGNTSTREGMFD